MIGGAWSLLPSLPSNFGNNGAIIAINRFGASAPGEDVMKLLESTTEHVV
jgi:transketolase